MNSTENFISAVKKYRNIMIIISGSPDPDAIASAFALKLILSYYSVNSEIIITKKISLQQNRAFVKYLDIPLHYKKSISPQRFDAYIIPDYQTNVVDGITNHIPCAAHIDHHTETDNRVFADFSLIRTDSGSTSSLVAMMVKDLEENFKKHDLIKISTALMFGIQTDTDKYEHATPIDIEALNFLSEYYDKDIINRINGIPVSPVTMSFYKRAILNSSQYKDWMIFGIGYIDIENRDSLAITADLLLKRQSCETVIVYAIVEDRKTNDLILDVSFRTKSPTLDINGLIKRITPSGGGRQFKGAYQIRLDYIQSCTDRNLLWKTVELATIEKLKKSRDGIYISGIRSAYSSALKRAISFFRK